MGYNHKPLVRDHFPSISKSMGLLVENPSLLYLDTNLSTTIESVIVSVSPKDLSHYIRSELVYKPLILSITLER